MRSIVSELCNTQFNGYIVNRYLECCNFNYLHCVFILASKIFFYKINYHVTLNDGQNAKWFDGFVTFATEKMVVTMEQEKLMYSKVVTALKI